MWAWLSLCETERLHRFWREHNRERIYSRVYFVLVSREFRELREIISKTYHKNSLPLLRKGCFSYFFMLISNYY